MKILLLFCMPLSQFAQRGGEYLITDFGAIADENATIVLGHLRDLRLENVNVYGDCEERREAYVRKDVTEASTKQTDE